MYYNNKINACPYTINKCELRMLNNSDKPMRKMGLSLVMTSAESHQI